MQCSQFLANSRQLGHPSFEVTSRPPGARISMKPTLQHSFGNRVVMHLRDGVLPESNYKKVLKTLHIETVTAVCNCRKPNRVLGTPQPEIHSSEIELHVTQHLFLCPSTTT
jgi:hypothetical protein